MTGYTRLPGISYIIGNRSILKDHLRRLIVQQHEADHTVYKAITSDASVPLDIRLQVRGAWASLHTAS